MRPTTPPRDTPAPPWRLRSTALTLGLVAAFTLAVVLFASQVREEIPGTAPASEGLSTTVHVLTWAGEDELRSPVPDSSAAFRLNPNRWAVSDLPVTVWFNPSGAPPGIVVEDLVRNALEQWSKVPGSAFAFAYAGTTTAGPGACDFASRQLDGRNTVTFGTTLPTGTLGITCAVWAGGSNGNLVEFDIQLNANVNWGRSDSLGPGQFDLASTILHELGHGAGLGHPCTGSGSCTDAERQAVMYPSLRAREQRNVLQDDDKAALAAAYPGAPQGGSGTVGPFRAVLPGVGRD